MLSLSHDSYPSSEEVLSALPSVSPEPAGFLPRDHSPATAIIPLRITACIPHCSRGPVGLLRLTQSLLTTAAGVILSAPQLGCVTLLLKTATASIPRTNLLHTISYPLSLLSTLSLSTPALVSLASFSTLGPVHRVCGSLRLGCVLSWLPPGSLPHLLQAFAQRLPSQGGPL